MKKLIITLFFVVLSQFSIAQAIYNFGRLYDGTFETVPDMNLNSCVNKASSITLLCSCYEHCTKEWETEIEKNLTLIKKNLVNYPKALASFERSQNLWETYRNEQLFAAFEYYYQFSKSRYGITNYHSTMVELSRERALNLKKYIINMDLR